MLSQRLTRYIRPSWRKTIATKSTRLCSPFFPFLSRFSSSASKQLVHKKQQHFVANGLFVRVMFNVEIATFMILCFIYDGYVLYKERNKIYALSEPKEEEPIQGVTESMLKSLKTGDVVIFRNRILDSQHTLGKMLLLALRSGWTKDRVGIIVYDADGTGDDPRPFILEKTYFSYRLLSVDERMLLSSAEKIEIRPLQGVRSPEHVLRVKQFIQQLPILYNDKKSDEEKEAFYKYYWRSFKHFLFALGQQETGQLSRINIMGAGPMGLLKSRVDFLSRYLAQYRLLRLAQEEEERNKIIEQNNNKNDQKTLPPQISLNLNNIKKRIEELENEAKEHFLKRKNKEWKVDDRYAFQDASLVAHVLQLLDVLPDPEKKSSSTTTTLPFFLIPDVSEYDPRHFRSTFALPINSGYSFGREWSLSSKKIK